MNVKTKLYPQKACKKESRKFIILPGYIFILLLTLLFPGGATGAAALNALPVVYCDGAVLHFDVSPQFFQETPMFPLRGIFEDQGFTVIWESSAKRVVLVGPGRAVYLCPGNPLFSVNGVVYRTSRPPVIVQGRVMVAMDFLEQSADWEEMLWEEKGAALHLKGSPGDAGEEWPATPPGEEEVKKYDADFIEVLLPAGEEVAAGENFKIIISAPFIGGIHAYAIRFDYDPEQIAVQELKNPAFNSQLDYSWNKIDDAAGVAKYLQTTLGYQEKIPPREPLVVLEARALREGVLSLPGEALQVTLLDNTATPMPAGLERKTLRITAFPQDGG